MCGILAVTGPKISGVSDEAINGALRTLAHRGPDGAHAVRLPSSILGQTRLSIIDLATGDQPMHDNENGNVITFNGEIYNYKELRAELEQKGHIFTTNSDTEVILKTYAEYEDACPEHLDGMFTFVLWDATQERIFFARDRFGKKPLYYAEQDGTFYFASEIKALKALGITGVLDPVAIDSYLGLMYVPPWRSIYSNIHPILPGHCGSIEDGKLTTRSYWSLPEEPIRITYEEAKEETRRLLKESVRKRMLAADVEVGSFLSGGVDSTLVTAYAAEHVSSPIKTFSVGYGTYINELPYAKEASERIGTDHYVLQANGSLIDEFEKVIAYFDEPHADSSDFPQHLVSELAGSKVKVALSGDGADELFLGYGWYWKYWNTTKIERLKNTFLSNPFQEYLKSVTFIDAPTRARLWKERPTTTDTPDTLIGSMSGNGMHKINRYDLTTYLPGQLLTKVDRAGMMHSLEVRCPFLDRDLAAFVYNLPEEYKSDKRQGKIILKDILTEIMPKDFVYRRKQGFGAPVLQWLWEPAFEAYLRTELENPNSGLYTFLKYEAVGDLIERFYTTKDDQPYYQLWILLTLSVWLRLHHPEL